MKLPGVISLRNALPIWAMPNGTLTRPVDTMFLNCTNIACAVSGRKYTSVPVSSTGPITVRNIMLN
jgi:hypothetical protein